MTTTRLNSGYAAVVDRLAELTVQIEELDAEREELKTTLRELGEGDYVLPDGFTPAVSVHPTRRFSAEVAKTVLPAETVDRCSDWVVVSAKARKLLSPDDYRRCQAETPHPTVRLAQ